MQTMDSVGKQLSQARLKRGLSVDEVAHATKLRSDKIIALENDDYGRFGSNAYARGFLVIYGKFLHVDVTAFAQTLTGSNPLNVTEYQYLNNPPVPVPEPTYVRRDRRKAPSIIPLVLFVLALVLAGFGYSTYKTFQRISDDPGGAPADLANTVPSSQVGEQTAVQSVPPLPNESADPAAPSFPSPPRAIAESTIALPANAALPEVRTAASVLPAAPVEGAAPPAKVAIPATLDSDVVVPLPVSNVPTEVLVEPLLKTRVIIRKNDPKSPPIFDDFLYPKVRPLKLTGKPGERFFIEAREPGAVQITKNGAPIAYQAPGITVQ